MKEGERQIKRCTRLAAWGKARETKNRCMMVMARCSSQGKHGLCSGSIISLVSKQHKKESNIDQCAGSSLRCSIWVWLNVQYSTVKPWSAFIVIYVCICLMSNSLGLYELWLLTNRIKGESSIKLTYPQNYTGRRLRCLNQILECLTLYI